MSFTLVATVQKRGRFWAAEPHFPPPRSVGDGSPSPGGRRSGGRVVQGGRGSRRIVLASNRVNGPQGGRAGPGDLVLVRIAERAGEGRAQIVRVIGRPEVARDAIEALLLHRGLAREFSVEVEREAERARERGLREAAGEVRRGSRRDLRDLATFTIDPASASDFDDAISAERLDGGGVRVWVHIADVGSYVPEGSLVDRQARERGTSVYVPGTVEPMLPEALSNDACSLVPEAERAAVTIELDLHGGEVRRSAFYRSLIRSDARLHYEQVDRIFEGEEPVRDPWGAPLGAAREAAAVLGRARERAGGLVVDSPEPEFLFDGEGHIREIAAREQTESHRLIEHLMIAANEAVARHLAAGSVPCLYRVHERPEPARVERLVAQLESLEIPTPPVPSPLSASQAAELMGEISQGIERHVSAALARGGGGRGPWGGWIALSSLVLRSLRQAYYSPVNVGHAGLRSECYCHFTSPIRRYPDLVCHRALLSSIGGPEGAPRASELSALGERTSELEREAMSIERAGDDLARCFALEQTLYEQGWNRSFQGEVAGLISAGAFVAFGGSRGPLYEGMVPVRRMRAGSAAGGGERADWWELNEQETILCGERSGAVVRLGDGITVGVARVDTVQGRVDLIPVG